MKRTIIMIIMALAISAGAQEKTAVVHIYRSDRATSLKPSFYCDGKDLGRLKSGHKMTVEIAPGQHSFQSNDRKQEPVTIDLKPGQEVYIRVDVANPGWVHPSHGRIFVVAAEQGKPEFEAIKGD